MPGEQALHEWAHVPQREPDRLQRPDLPDEPHVVPVIDAVPVGRTPRRKQPLRLVVAKRPGSRAGRSGQFPYAHCHGWLTPPLRPSLNIDASVNASGEEAAVLMNSVAGRDPARQRHELAAGDAVQALIVGPMPAGLTLASVQQPPPAP